MSSTEDPDAAYLRLSLPALVMAFKIDECTLADWLEKAGKHAARVQDHFVCQGQLDLGQVPAGGLWCRSQRGVLWLATAESTVNTAFVERLDATLRTWLPALTRRFWPGIPGATRNACNGASS